VRAVDGGIDLCALGMNVSASSSVTNSWIRTVGVRGQKGQLVETILEGCVLLESGVYRTNSHDQVASVGNSGDAGVEQSDPLSFGLEESRADSGRRICESGIEHQTSKEPQVLDFDRIIYFQVGSPIWIGVDSVVQVTVLEVVHIEDVVVAVQRTGIPDVARGDLRQNPGTSGVLEREDDTNIFGSHVQWSEGTNAFDGKGQFGSGGFGENRLHQIWSSGHIELIHPFVGNVDNVLGAGSTIHSKHNNQYQ